MKKSYLIFVLLIVSLSCYGQALIPGDKVSNDGFTIGVNASRQLAGDSTHMESYYHALTTYLKKSNNLSDLTNVSSARSNLGLGSFATINSLSFSSLTVIPNTINGYGITDAYTKTQGDNRYFQIGNNLSEGTAATMRSNLGLGTAAQQNTGIFLQAGNNLSDIGSQSSARSNIGAQAAITTGTTSQYFDGTLSLRTFPTLLSSFTNDPGYLTSFSEVDPVWTAASGNYRTKAQNDLLYSDIAHTHTFASLTSKPTTLSGYGITDGVTASSTDLFTNKTGLISQWTNDAGYLTSFENIYNTDGTLTSNRVLNTNGQTLEMSDNGLKQMFIDPANKSWSFGDYANDFGTNTGFIVDGVNGSMNITAPKGIKVNSSYTFPLTDGATNDVIVTDGAGNLSWSPLPTSVTPAALTKADDTNIKLTLGGTPATSLLQAVSITAEWAGTLADGRITSSSNWNTAYTNRITSLTTTGSSGAATLSSNTLNIPNYTLSGLGGEPTITAPNTTLKYWTGYKTFGSFNDTARAAISLTVTGSSGASTYNSSTGVFNIPTYTLSGLGGITQTAADARYFQISNNLSEGTAATMRTNIGATTTGSNLLTLANPSAITFIRINADNSVTARSAANFRSDIGAGTGDGTVTSVSGTTNRITSTGGNTPVLDISSTYDALWQPVDADLTTISGLTATTNNFLVSVSSAWASRTPAQVKTTLSLDNVTNESKATMFTSPTFTGTAVIPSPFTLGSTSVTATGTQLNYLNAATGTTGTTSTNLVFSTSPTLTNPVVGTQTFGDNSTLAASTAFIQAMFYSYVLLADTTGGAGNAINLPTTGTFTIGANQTWQFDCWVAGQISSSSGVRMQAFYSVAPSKSFVWYNLNPGSVLTAQTDALTFNTTPATSATSWTGIATDETAQGHFTVINGGSSTNVTVRFTPVNGGQTVTLHAGCNISAHRVY
jgi:hypothetical protein